LREPRRIAPIAALVLFLALAVSPLRAAEISPPEDGHFVQDLAGLISGEDALKIQQQGKRLLSDHAIPLVVLTLDSMAEQGGGRTTIETFARLQFEAWGHHPAFPYTENWRRGILLVVAREDRKARIELGAEWALEYDSQCEQIMREILVPAFKAGLYSDGIADGTEALVRMSRGDDVDVTLLKAIEYKLRSALVDWEYKVGEAGVIVLILLLGKWLDLGRSPYSVFSDRSSNGRLTGSFGGGGGASGSW
jgi:uncharacterized protein